jgi:hypothetical protein
MDSQSHADDLCLDPEQALDELKDTSELLAASLVISASRTRDIVEEQEALLGEPMREGAAYAHLVRLFTKMEMKRRLRDSGFPARLRYVPNTGLHIDIGRFSAKILKPGRDGGVPEALTLARQRFYNQEYAHQYALELDGDGDVPEGRDVPEGPHRNVVYVWDVDRSGELKNFYLAYPVPDEDSAWTEPIPLMRGEVTATVTAAASQLEDFDLPITPRNQDEGGDEQSHQR